MLNRDKRIKFPVNLEHRDRPDFLLSMGTNEIGIEHIEAVPENEAHKVALREQGFGHEVYYLSPGAFGERKKSAHELIQEMEANNLGEGWIGDSVEREWTQAMSDCIQKKIDALHKNGFSRFNDNWLLIYDNLSLPYLQIKEATALLAQNANKNLFLYNFSHIFILLKEKFLCELSGQNCTVTKI